MRMPRIVVLGAASALGSHVCDRLLRRGYEVVGVDDLSSGSFANVAHLRREPRFAFVEHDLVEPFHVDASGIFHLAVPSTRERVESDPVRAIHTCVAGSLHALATARTCGASLVFVTSTERFGEGVRCAEALANHHARRFGVDVRVVRLPEIYGPRMPPSETHPVSALVLAALRREAPPPFDDAPDRPLRLVYVDDAVETLVRAMGCPVPTPPIVAPSVETTLGRLAELVAVEAGLATRREEEAADPPPRSLSVTRATLDGALPAALVLGPTPSTALARGLRRTLRWFSARMDRRTSLPPSSVSDTLGKACEASASTRFAPSSARAPG